MFASTSQSSSLQKSSDNAPHQRVAAAAAVSFKHDGEKTRLGRLYQQGSAKIRFPKHHSGQKEAVLINTAGGLTGGDSISWDIEAGQSCDVVVTTQACEKSYRSCENAAFVQTSIKLEKNSRLHWLPQETILYEKSALSRDFSVVMDPSSELLAIESGMLGREAMGEAIESISFHDRWRIMQGDRLVFADDLRLSGPSNSIASLGKSKAFASLLFIAPKDNEYLRNIADRLRAICPAEFSGFSAFDGKITGRILSQDTYQLRRALVPVLRILRGTELPRVWRI